jgi:hypothetical protein
MLAQVFVTKPQKIALLRLGCSCTSTRAIIRDVGNRDTRPTGPGKWNRMQISHALAPRRHSGGACQSRRSKRTTMATTPSPEAPRVSIDRGHCPCPALRQILGISIKSMAMSTTGLRTVGTIRIKGHLLMVLPGQRPARTEIAGWSAAVPGATIHRAFAPPSVTGSPPPIGSTTWTSVSSGRLPHSSLPLPCPLRTKNCSMSWRRDDGASWDRAGITLSGLSIIEGNGSLRMNELRAYLRFDVAGRS